MCSTEAAVESLGALLLMERKENRKNRTEELRSVAASCQSKRRRDGGRKKRATQLVPSVTGLSVCEIVGKFLSTTKK